MLDKIPVEQELCRLKNNRHALFLIEYLLKSEFGIEILRRLFFENGGSFFLLSPTAPNGTRPVSPYFGREKKNSIVIKISGGEFVEK